MILIIITRERARTIVYNTLYYVNAVLRCWRKNLAFPGRVIRSFSPGNLCSPEALAAPFESDPLSARPSSIRQRSREPIRRAISLAAKVERCRVESKKKKKTCFCARRARVHPPFSWFVIITRAHYMAHTSRTRHREHDVYT